MIINDIRMKVCFVVVILICYVNATRGGEWGSEGRHLKVGIITEGQRRQTEVSIRKFEFNISAIWAFVTFTEVFQIFREVQRYDSDESIDVILLFDYEPDSTPNPALIQVKNKNIILSPRSRNYSNSVAEHFKISKDDVCETETFFLGSEESPYCEMEINGQRKWHNSVKRLDTDETYHLDPNCLQHSYKSTGYLSNIGSKVLFHLVVRELRWSRVIIIHENGTELEVQELMDSLSRSGILFAVYNIDTIEDLHATLQNIYLTTVRLTPQINFVVLCRAECVRKVLRSANQFDSSNVKLNTLLKQFSRWLTVVYGHSGRVSRTLNACANDLDNVATIAIPDVNGPAVKDLLDIFDHTLTELYDELTNGSKLLNSLKQQVVETLTEKVLYWTPASRCAGYKIDTLLWTASGRGFSTVGYVDKQGRVVLKSSEVFPNTKYGYNKREFTVSTLEYAPFVMKNLVKKTDPITGNITIVPKYEGFTMDLLEELARVLNFTYSIMEPADQKWGGLIVPENYTFNGLIGQLQREECDLVAAPISIQPDREVVVDFSYPFFYEYTTVMVKKPNLQTVKWRTLIDPFKWEVLVSIGIALGVVTVLIFLLEKYNPFYNVPSNGDARRTNGGLHYLHNSFWYMYGALLCQGGVHLPDSTAGRTFVSCWWLMCIVVVGIYSGNLIAFLTVTKEKPPFNTLAEMVETSGLKWGTLGATNWETIFMTSTIPIFKKIGDGMRKFNQTDSGVLNINLAYHLNRVKDGGYAWIGDKTAIEIEISRECDLIKIKDEFLPMKYAIGFPNNSPHNMFFSEHLEPDQTPGNPASDQAPNCLPLRIMKLHESGLLQIWKRKWWPKANFCASNSVPEAKPIQLIDVQSAFYVCLVGTFLGTVAFVAELIIFKIKSCKKGQQPRAMVRCVSNISTAELTD